MPERPRAIVYIDGFNLYRRALSGHPEIKWLDLVALSKNILPDYDVIKVKYFTSQTKPFAYIDPGRATRHQIYLRALGTLSPTLEITLGTFRSDSRLMAKLPLEIDSSGSKFKLVKVRKIEEKGSDVNLAIQLVSDSYNNESDISIILTNDSDQVGPLNLIRQELNQQTGIIFPVPGSRSSKSLMNTKPNITRFLTYNLLCSSQLADELRDARGLIRRPKEWRNSEGPITGAF